MFEIKASFVLIYAVLLHCCINNLEKTRRRALISGSRFRAVGRSENPWGRASSNMVGIICPPLLFGIWLTDLHRFGGFRIVAVDLPEWGGGAIAPLPPFSDSTAFYALKAKRGLRERELF